LSDGVPSAPCLPREPLATWVVGVELCMLRGKGVNGAGTFAFFDPSSFRLTLFLDGVPSAPSLPREPLATWVVGVELCRCVSAAAADLVAEVADALATAAWARATCGVPSEA